MAVRTFTTLTEPTWKRQPGETMEAFRRFTVYLNQPREDSEYRRSEGRSLYRVATAVRVSDRAITELAEKHRWEDRARDYDSACANGPNPTAAAAHQQHRDTNTSAALAAQTDLIHYVRASVHHLTERGTYLDPHELNQVADAIATLHSLTRPAPPSPAPERADPTDDTTRIGIVGLHVADIRATGPGTALERGGDE